MSLIPVEKLKGRENYVSWAFAMRMVMIREGTWRTVDPPEGTEVNADLSERALATICLSIEPYNYSLVQKAKTAIQECGTTWKISLLRKQTRLELEDCSSMERYVIHKPKAHKNRVQVGRRVAFADPADGFTEAV